MEVENKALENESLVSKMVTFHFHEAGITYHGKEWQGMRVWYTTLLYSSSVWNHVRGIPRIPPFQLSIFSIPPKNGGTLSHFCWSINFTLQLTNKSVKMDDWKVHILSFSGFLSAKFSGANLLFSGRGWQPHPRSNEGSAKHTLYRRGSGHQVYTSVTERKIFNPVKHIETSAKNVKNKSMNW